MAQVDKTMQSPFNGDVEFFFIIGLVNGLLEIDQVYSKGTASPIAHIFVQLKTIFSIGRNTRRVLFSFTGRQSFFRLIALAFQSLIFGLWRQEANDLAK
jgi:hypothetical protein